MLQRAKRNESPKLLISSQLKLWHFEPQIASSNRCSRRVIDKRRRTTKLTELLEALELSFCFELGLGLCSCILSWAEKYVLFFLDTDG